MGNFNDPILFSKNKIMKAFIFSILIFTIAACTNKPAPILKTVNFDELSQVINKNDDVLYVVNFWATWCSPCVEELPDFMELNREFSNNSNFKMILVSLDKASELYTAVKPFIENQKVDADVYLLDDNKRMNYWIPSIDAGWSGAIPATLLIRNGQKLHFEENKLDKNELKQIIQFHL